MKSFRRVLEHHTSDPEAGISLVEVMVAMLIFTIVSLGIIEALISTASFAIDSRARETATNLAAQAIDTARATPDLFNLFNDLGHQYTIDGRTYTVNRVAQWVSDPNQVAPCGAGGGALQYKRVNVTVTWAGMNNPNAPVRSDTLIAPTTRVSDPADATILVSVENGSALGVSGVTVTTSPVLSPPAKVTDVDGCSYLLKVPPGSYTITVNKTGYVDPTQNSSPSKGPLTVTAGASLSVPFSLDVRQPLLINYATNYSGTPKFPTNLYTGVLHATDPAIDASTLGNPVQLYPYADGYSVVTGHYQAKSTGTQGCLSPNPTLWAAGTVGSQSFVPPPTQIAVPGPGHFVNVPMGIVQVTGTAANQAVSAVVQTTGPGTADPGCAAIATTYAFGNVLGKNTTTTLALPFGTYKLYYSNDGSGTPIGATSLSVTAPSTIMTSGGSTTVTLDPRVLAQ